VSEVDIREGVIVVGGMVVRDEQVDIKSLVVDLADAEALAAEPVAVQQLVRVAVQTKLVKSDVLGESG
jgi:hypothetical protein